MRRSFLFMAAVAASWAVLGGCLKRVELDPDAARDIHRLAVVVRVLGEPTVDLPDAQRPKGKANGDVAHIMGQRLSNFEIGERLRSTVQQGFPEHAPFLDVAPSAQVESIFGSLLTEEKPVGPPRFNDLQSIGVDGVLYMEVSSWGARTVEGKWQIFLSGYGRIFTLPGDSTVWRAPIEVSSDGASLPPKWGEEANLRSAFDDLSERAGAQIDRDLGGGGSDTGHHSSVLDQPEIEDKGHPPEKLKPVIPFDFDAGAPPDAGRPHAEKPAQDAGDTLFPDVGR